MAALLRLHVGRGGGDAVEHALDVDVDHPVPFVDLEAIHGRERHQAGVVDDHVDAPVGLHGTVHETPDLLVLRHVCLHGGVVAQRQLSGERLKPFKPPCPQHQPSPAPGEMTRGSLAQPAARAGNDDDLAFDFTAHPYSPLNILMSLPDRLPVNRLTFNDVNCVEPTGHLR